MAESLHQGLAQWIQCKLYAEKMWHDNILVRSPFVLEGKNQLDQSGRTSYDGNFYAPLVICQVKLEFRNPHTISPAAFLFESLSSSCCNAMPARRRYRQCWGAILAPRWAAILNSVEPGEGICLSYGCSCATSRHWCWASLHASQITEPTFEKTLGRCSVLLQWIFHLYYAALRQNVLPCWKRAKSFRHSDLLYVILVQWLDSFLSCTWLWTGDEIQKSRLVEHPTGELWDLNWYICLKQTPSNLIFFRFYPFC